MGKKIVSVVSCMIIVAACVCGFLYYKSLKPVTLSINTTKIETPPVNTDEPETETKNKTDKDAKKDTEDNSEKSSSVEPQMGTAIQKVSLGSLSFEMDGEYVKQEIDTESLNGFVDDCVEYDKSDGMIMAAVKNSSTFYNTSLSIIESYLIDTNSYKLQGENSATYDNGDWLIHLYLSDDKSTASYIASSEIDGKTVYMLLHCKYDDKVSDTEFVNILKSVG